MVIAPFQKRDSVSPKERVHKDQFHSIDKKSQYECRMKSFLSDEPFIVQGIHHQHHPESVE